MDEMDQQEHEAFPFGIVGAKKEESQIYLSLLLEREKEFYPTVHQGFMRAIASTTSNVDSGEAVRNKLCEWCYKVADYFNFDREVCAIAMEYFDRTVALLQSSQREPPLSKRMIQLISVTSLYMAIKIHGESDDDGKDTTPRLRRKLRIDAYVTISHGFFTVEAIAAMERKILEILNWNINPPTGYQFISSLLALCPPPCPTGTIRNITDVARYLSELSVCSSYFSSRCRTSVAAYASVLCAMEAIPELPSHFREIFVKNASEATGLNQDDEAVQRACAKLKDLCPSIFGPPNNAGVHNVIFFDNANDDAAAARVVSPVSVVEDDEAYDNNRRCAGKWETSPPMPPPPPEHQPDDEGLGDLPINSGRKRSRSPCDGGGDKATHKEFHRRVSL